MMKKIWKGNSGGPGGSSSDLSSCRGHGIVIATCDVAREREASKELVNLLTQAIEYFEEQFINNGEDICVQNDELNNPQSVQDMLTKELNETKDSKNGFIRQVISIQTSVKGVVVAKLNKKDYCPIALVDSIFERVSRDRLPCSRHLVRLVPLKYVFYPNEEELSENISRAARTWTDGSELPGISSLKKRKFHILVSHTEDNHGDEKDGSKNVLEALSQSSRPVVSKSSDEREDDAPKTTPTIVEANPVAVTSGSLPTVKYHIVVKARNNNSLPKNTVYEAIYKHMPKHTIPDYRQPQVSVYSLASTILSEAALLARGISRHLHVCGVIQ
jgi:hypothetical protein